LFHDGELPHGLRDLTDLDLLLREAASQPGFWAHLTTRAAQLQLQRSLFYALRYARHFLETPVPEPVMRTLDAAAPRPALLKLMDAVFSRVLAPQHASCDDRWSGLARFAAYVRAHWLRMPLYLLLPHLLHKAFVRPYQDDQPETVKPRQAA
jgi:hypothetical protein